MKLLRRSCHRRVSGSLNSVIAGSFWRTDAERAIPLWNKSLFDGSQFASDPCCLVLFLLDNQQSIGPNSHVG